MSDSNKQESLVCVGVISAVHGIKGQVKISTFTQNPEDITTYGRLFDKNGKPLFEIKNFKLTPKAMIVRLSGIDTRNQAEQLKGTELFIQRETLPQPDEEEFYYSDLTGLNVQFRNGTHYGTVKSIQNFGAGDLVEILPDPSMVTTKSGKKAKPSGKIETVFYNFTKEVFPQINISEGYITLLPPKMVEDSQSDQDAFLEEQEKGVE